MAWTDTLAVDLDISFDADTFILCINAAVVLDVRDTVGRTFDGIACTTDWGFRGRFDGVSCGSQALGSSTGAR
jgi:hypothetical protein